jgi:hypothetical protein
MKRIKIQVLATNDFDSCKHTMFTCGDCGTVIYKRKILTPKQQARMEREFHKLAQAVAETFEE